MRISSCGRTDVGLARKHNEDCYDSDQQQGLYVVADGMGGHSHGEIASRIAVDAIFNFIGDSSDGDITRSFVYDPGLQSHSNRLKNSVRVAHKEVLKAIRKDGSLHGMGTTVVGLLLRDKVAAVAHVGDSRAYRVRDRELKLLTQDHTWVNEQVAAGYLSQEQARIHPLKNVVTRALGSEKDVVVDVNEVEVAAGDRYLLCSDGLTTMLSDEEIKERLTAEAPLEEICDTLVNDANARGGLDNVTVLLLSVEDDPNGDGS
jgi:serine/threonine protein phosphatase PrpC